VVRWRDRSARGWSPFWGGHRSSRFHVIPGGVVGWFLHDSLSLNYAYTVYPKYGYFQFFGNVTEVVGRYQWKKLLVVPIIHSLNGLRIKKSQVPSKIQFVYVMYMDS